MAGKEKALGARLTFEASVGLSRSLADKSTWKFFSSAKRELEIFDVFCTGTGNEKRRTLRKFNFCVALLI